MFDHTKYWDFNSKMRQFGLTDDNFHTYITKYPVVRISTPWRDVYEWCQTELGNNWIWVAPDSGCIDMYFIYSEDAVTFKLKFSRQPGLM